MAEEFFKGKVFKSEEEVKKIVDDYEKAYNCKLFRRSSKKFTAVKIFEGPFNDKLNNFYEITYQCVLGGNYKSKSTGKRVKE